MELSGIGQYLEIYQKRLFSAEDQKMIILNVIKKVSGVSVDEQDITIKDTKISIKTDAVTRGQLFIYKKKILDEIKRSSSKLITELS